MFAVHAKTKLDLDEAKRKLKWGRYGIYKYVYPDTEQARIQQLLRSLISQHFPEAELQYFT